MREEVEEVPLRHERGELAVRGQVAEIGGLKGIVAIDASGAFNLLMRLAKEIVQQAEFVKHIEGRWVHGVAAEIAEEVAVLFEYGDRHARAGEQKSQHDSSRTATNYAAVRL